MLVLCGKRRTCRFKIPGGVDSGSRLKLRGEGEAGPVGGIAGDLYVTIQVGEHPLFERQHNEGDL